MNVTYVAREFTMDDPFKLMFILDQVCKHRPWFSDYLWEDEQVRRTSASGYIADALANGKLWEVYKVDPSADPTTDLVGIMMVNQVTYKIGGTCHFIFFDGELQSKRQLCLQTMAWTFQNLDLQILRVEIPTYAHKLASWVQKKLGFRFEAEGRPLKWPSGKRPLTRKQAEMGSRKYRATKYKGQWVDALLLSITKEEFEENVRSLPEAGSDQHSPVSDSNTPSPGLPKEHP